ncbi:unnamed protein product [Schistocephalus solidus]|uniref:Uncharacterized protein n=1 Tax=Schistocephalus solidus TaxID=70667 RepID=A0A183SQX0_SCHSO|nr:unnamed protein product [Schistocephalus solidus]
MLSRPSLSALRLQHGIDLGVMASEQRRVGCPGDEYVSGLPFADVPEKYVPAQSCVTSQVLLIVLSCPPWCVEPFFQLFTYPPILGFEPNKISSQKGSSGLT